MSAFLFKVWVSFKSVTLVLWKRDASLFLQDKSFIGFFQEHILICIYIQII